jgi:hypothetical protein
MRPTYTPRSLPHHTVHTESSGAPVAVTVVASCRTPVGPCADSGLLGAESVLSGKDAKLAAAKEKATLKAAKLLEEVLAVGEAEAGGKPRKTREEVEALVVSGKPRKTREEVEALVVSGKLYATVRTQLCKPFSQV